MFYKVNLVKKISIIMILAIWLISCASDPAAENNDETNTVTNNSSGNNPSLQVQNSPEGLLLTFDEIPSDATSLFINAYEGEHDGKLWSDVFGIVIGPKLDEVKVTKRLICPFAKKDQPYAVSVQFVINGEVVSGSDIIEVVPTQDAAYLSNTVELQLNDEQSGVTLSAEPQFSAPVESNEYKYEYVLLNIINENESWSSNIYNGNELSCSFAPETINLIKEADPNLSGTFASHVVALSNLDYEGIFWKVKIAQTEAFDIEF